MLEVTAYTGLGEGVHDINVTGLMVKQAKAGGDYLRWEFTAADGRTASANTSKEMTPGNKTGKWFSALTGKPTVIGENRQMAEVIGAPGTIVIEINAEGYPKVIALTGRKADAPRRATTPQDAPQAPAAATVEDDATADPLPF